LGGGTFIKKYSLKKKKKRDSKTSCEWRMWTMMMGGLIEGDVEA
jgi:hypothetical protein